MSQRPSWIDEYPSEMQVAIAHFCQFHDLYGKKQCRKRGVGAPRKYLKAIAALPQNVIPIAKPEQIRQQEHFEQQFEQSAAKWREALSDVCDLLRQVPLGREGDMTSANNDTGADQTIAEKIANEDKEWKHRKIEAFDAMFAKRRIPHAAIENR